MTTITKAVFLILWATFAFMAIAVPAPRDYVDDMAKATPAACSPISGTPTHDSIGSVCTNGMPASKQFSAAEYPINNYTVITPAENWLSYQVDPEWQNDHFVSGPHYMAFTYKSDPYGAFKCQYTCNAAENCNAYFVWYENIGTEDEHLNCVLFDAVIPSDMFVQTNGTLATGAYDKLCDHNAN